MFSSESSDKCTNFKHFFAVVPNFVYLNRTGFFGPVHGDKMLQLTYSNTSDESDNARNDSHTGKYWTISE